MGTSKFVLGILLLSVGLFQCNDTIQKTIQNTNGNQTVYQKCSTDSKTLVFIHAGGLDQQMWQPQVSSFKHDYQIITYDLRGHGASSFTENTSYDIDDLMAILEREQVDSMYLIGCSLGAIFALDFTINYPEQVHKLVLVSPGLIGLQEKDSLFLRQMGEYVEAMQQGDTTAMITQLKMLNAIGRKERTLPAMIDRYVHQQLKKFVISPGLTRPPVLKTLDPINHLPAIHKQTLLLVGEWDHEYIHKNAQYLHQQLPIGSLEIIKKAGHLPNMEQAEAFNKQLRQFITKSN